VETAAGVGEAVDAGTYVLGVHRVRMRAVGKGGVVRVGLKEVVGHLSWDGGVMMLGHLVVEGGAGRRPFEEEGPFVAVWDLRGRNSDTQFGLSIVRMCGTRCVCAAMFTWSRRSCWAPCSWGKACQRVTANVWHGVNCYVTQQFGLHAACALWHCAVQGTCRS
jgi:hypothetical protein